MTDGSQTAIESHFRGVLAANAVAGASPAWAVDGVTPAIVVQAADAAETAAVLRAANESGLGVIPRGTSAHMGFGNTPARYDIALDMRRLGRIVEYEPADLTVTVEAGMLLSSLQRTLAAQGQWLPLDPPGDGTIGGLLAANRSGPARMQFGTARDLVIGMEVVSAEGQIVKSGGRVVKNVAGYDLAKLHIGAIGTLGVITQASFKVAPLPAVSRTAVYSGQVTSLMSISFAIRDRGLAVFGLTLRASNNGAWLTIRFAGGAAAVERSRHEVAGIALELGLIEAETDAKVEEAEVPIVSGRVSTLPTAISGLLAPLIDSGAGVTAYPTVGVMHAGWTEPPALETLAALRMAARATGGALVLESAPAAMKEQFDVWGEPGGDFALMKHLKQQFDPNGTLSPGRFVGGL